MAGRSLALLVGQRYVKTIKSALEQQDLLDRSTKISREKGSLEQARMIITTTIPFTGEDIHDDNSLDDGGLYQETENLLRRLGLDDLKDEIEVSLIRTSHLGNDGSNSRNPLIKALIKAFRQIPESLLESVKLTAESLISSFPSTYSIYGSMLLLPPNAFTSTPWKTLISVYSVNSKILIPLWKTIAIEVGITHIAINAGIPVSTTTSSIPNISTPEAHSRENILRSPVNLTPIYGDFGPPPTPSRLANPTLQDFDDAYWVSTTQNGVKQVWAPVYTMFSRGNIKEKTRLLNLPSVNSAVSDGKGKTKISDPQQINTSLHSAAPGCTAVDLYAGIGYFVFSYKKAGVSKIICWELNPWSIEGLRRGALRNGWSIKIFNNIPNFYEEFEAEKQAVKNADIIVFQQSNEEAVGPISRLAWGPNSEDDAPPIRHVNCGFLPSSRGSWKTAVRVMDSELGGWIHAHENVGVNDIESRREEVVVEIQRLLDEWEAEKGCCGGYRERVRCEHVEKVKTYAPGVIHVVLDVWIRGRRDAEELT